MIEIRDFAVGSSRQLDGRNHQSVRAARSSVDGDLLNRWAWAASSTRVSFNLPRGGCGPGTRRAAFRLRGHHCVEAVVNDSSNLDGVLGLGGSRRIGVRRAGRSAAARDRWRSRGPSAGGQPDVAQLSATGSERMGTEIAPRVAARMGRALLELGGNNAAVVAPSADLELAHGESSSPPREPPVSAARPCVG